MKTFHLERGDTLSIANGMRAEVDVVAGELWLTQPKDARDYLLRDGQAKRVATAGTVLVYAFKDSIVRLRGAVHGIVRVRRRGEAPAVEPAWRLRFATFMQRPSFGQ